jgi:hypothetical protein
MAFAWQQITVLAVAAEFSEGTIAYCRVDVKSAHIDLSLPPAGLFICRIGVGGGGFFGRGTGFVAAFGFHLSCYVLPVRLSYLHISAFILS